MPADAPTVVRRARLSDAPALKAILHDTFESTWLPNITSQAAEAYLAGDRAGRYVAERGLEFRAAERGGEVVGFVHWQDDFVHALHVRSDHARRGVGARLMDTAEAEITRLGHARVRLETDTFNARSRAFYRARGFIEIGRYADQEWNSGLTTVLLAKVLG